MDPRLIIPGIHNLLSHDPHAFKDSKEDKIRNNAHVEEPFRRLEKLYISTCMLTMHPLNILNMWPIIYNKLIVAGAGPVHSCMCNRLLIQWQTFEILTMSSPQRQPKYAGSATQQVEILHLPCLLTYFKTPPIALFNRVTSLNILLNSIVQTNNGTCILLEWLCNTNQF